MKAVLQRSFRLLRTAWAVRKIHQAPNAESKALAQHALADILAGSRGLPMKVGQVMAGMGDDSHYAALTQSVEPWPLQRMLFVLEKAWGHPAYMMVKSIEESRSAASLGQVHKAWLNGRDVVAIKIQYPDMAQAMDAEMKLANWLPAGGPVKQWAFDMDAYKKNLKETLHDELDYLHEMKQQMIFAGSVKVKGLLVPQTFPHLCRPNVLVQTWVDGVRLSEAARWGLPERLFIGRTLMQTMFQSLFEFGLVHGDPHPGNMLFQYDPVQPTTILLDYGCMISVDETRRKALLKLLLSSRGECTSDPLATFSTLGFDAAKLRNIEAKLPALMQLLFRPFIEERPFDVEHWNLSEGVAELLGDGRWWFRSAAPADLFLIVRVFQGLVTQLALLQVKLPWWPILQQALHEKTITSAKRWSVDGVDVPETVAVSGSATELFLLLQAQGKEPMRITLTAASALELESLMPEHLVQEIKDTGVDLQAIRQRLIVEGLEPQPLVDVVISSYHCVIELR